MRRELLEMVCVLAIRWGKWQGRGEAELVGRGKEERGVLWKHLARGLTHSRCSVVLLVCVTLK